MKITSHCSAFVLLATLLTGLGCAERKPATANQKVAPPAIQSAQTQQQGTAPATSNSSPDSATGSSGVQRDRSAAYYHYTLAHMYEEMAAITARAEYANKAVEEYRKAIQFDPASEYLNAGLAELYAKTGRIKDALLEAQDIIKRDPNNLEARRLLGRIYLRSLGDMQAGTQSQNILKLAIEQYEAIVVAQPDSVEDHLLLGRLYKIDNQNEKAEKQFNAAVKLQPNSEEAVTTLAYLYNELQDSTRALQILQGVPERDRTDKIYAALGFTYEQKKDYKNAIAAFRKAADSDKDNLDAMRGLAQNLMNDGQIDAALTEYKKIIEADPQDAQTYMRIAEIYRRDGKFEPAMAMLKKAQVVIPDSLEVPYNLAVIYESVGRYDDASQTLQQLITRSEKSSGLYTPGERNNLSIFLERLGTIYRESKKPQQAVETFRKMIPLGNDNASRAYQQIVETYRDQRDWKAATATAEEAVKKLPEDRGLRMILASQKADLGQEDAAIAEVKSMLKGGSEDRETYVALAQMYSRLRRWPDAEQAIQKALSLSNRQEEKDYVQFVAGSIYERQKKYDLAEQSFRQVLANDPRNATALNYLGYMLADRGVRLEEALGLIKRAVGLDPQNGAYLDSLGWAYFKLGNYDLAEDNLRKAIEKTNNDPAIHDHLADVYLKTGRLKLAIAHWERALDEWNKTVSAEVEPNDVVKVQKKLEAARVKFARQGKE